MNSKVRVTGDAAGNVVIPSENNPEWGYIRVEQDKIQVDDNGFAKKKLTSALIFGKLTDLKAFGWGKGLELEGTIVAKDSLIPFNKLDPEKDLKVAGKTGVICTIEGKPIYRKTFYRQDANAQDVFIQHDNSSDIRSVAQSQEAEAPATEAVDQLQGK